MIIWFTTMQPLLNHSFESELLECTNLSNLWRFSSNIVIVWQFTTSIADDIVWSLIENKLLDSASPTFHLLLFVGDRHRLFAKHSPINYPYLWKKYDYGKFLDKCYFLTNDSKGMPMPSRNTNAFQKYQRLPEISMPPRHWRQGTLLKHTPFIKLL